MGNNDIYSELELPPKPEEPDPYECCGRGCDPCIYDYYAKRVARWEKQVKALKKDFLRKRNRCS